MNLRVLRASSSSTLTLGQKRRRSVTSVNGQCLFDGSVRWFDPAVCHLMEQEVKEARRCRNDVTLCKRHRSGEANFSLAAGRTWSGRLIIILNYNLITRVKYLSPNMFSVASSCKQNKTRRIIILFDLLLVFASLHHIIFENGLKRLPRSSSMLKS